MSSEMHNLESSSWEKNLLREFLLQTLKEQRSERRWLYFIRALRALMFIVFMLFMSGLFFIGPFNRDVKFPHTAFIDISGEIAKGALNDADHIIPALQSAFDSENVKGVVLRINSPGGSPVQASQIYQEIKRQKKLHASIPIIAVIDDLGASGGYYIASAADKIYADQSSIVGSIGVISSGFGFTGLMDKLGIERRTITAGKNKALLDPFQPLSPEMKTYWEAMLAQTHQQFIDRVKEGRGARLHIDDTTFTGLVWNGEQAAKIGLIDGFGDLHSVARDIIKTEKLISYNPRNDVFDRLTQKVSVMVNSISFF